jgi:2-polyprenyl-6-methoxyphenol hydroxylase-like FAD-dependent oxidoreductase
VRSSVARLVGAPYDRIGHHATGVIFSYWPVARGDGYHWYFRQGVSAGVIPTNDGLACVFVGVPQSRFRDEFRLGPGAGHARLMRTFWPELADRLERVQRADRYRGFGGEVGYFRRSWGPGWALVGDAGHFKHPATAQGISDAIEQALHVAEGLNGADPELEGYEAWRDSRAAEHYEWSYNFARFPEPEKAGPLFGGLASDPEAGQEFRDVSSRLVEPRSGVFTNERLARWFAEAAAPA